MAMAQDSRSVAAYITRAFPGILPKTQRAAIRKRFGQLTDGELHWFIEDGDAALPAVHALDRAVRAGGIHTVCVHSVGALAGAVTRSLVDVSAWQSRGVRLLFVADGIDLTLNGERSGAVFLQCVSSLQSAHAAKWREQRASATRKRTATLRKKRRVAVQLHDDGKPVESIAETLRIQPGTVERMLTARPGQSFLGGPRNTGRTKADPTTAYELFEHRGRSYEQVAAALGVSSRTAIRYVQQVCGGNPAPQPATT